MIRKQWHHVICDRAAGQLKKQGKPVEVKGLHKGKESNIINIVTGNTGRSRKAWQIKAKCLQRINSEFADSHE